MPKWKEGDHVRVIARDVTEEDRKKNRYFEHMAGLTGTIESVYSDTEIAVKVDPSSMSKVTLDVHTKSTERMKDKFLEGLPQEQKRNLTEPELAFKAQYVLLVQATDLENA
ncbi:MAG: hypothetical protein P4L46_18510 [Fimbriimonas sp.]|nr:hypothetical protein [Fimbriimonas sp.]